LTEVEEANAWKISPAMAQAQLDQQQQRITQLEGALKAFVDTYRVMYNMDQVYPSNYENHQRLEQELLSAFLKAQHALTPESHD
jgi:hypothetical protein